MTLEDLRMRRPLFELAAVPWLAAAVVERDDCSLVPANAAAETLLTY